MVDLTVVAVGAAVVELVGAVVAVTSAGADVLVVVSASVELVVAEDAVFLLLPPHAAATRPAVTRTTATHQVPERPERFPNM